MAGGDFGYIVAWFKKRISVFGVSFFLGLEKAMLCVFSRLSAPDLGNCMSV